MMREEPLFRKCCYFLPLRVCLHTWAYIKVIADILATSYIVIVIAILNGYDYGNGFKQLSILHLLVLVVVSLIVDIGFLVTLATGIFMKSVTLLRVFYYYEFYSMTVETIIVILVCVNMLQVNLTQGVIYTIIGALYILLDVCITLTVKSEMIKLRNKDQYDFSRMPACQADFDGTGNFKIEEE